MSIRFLACLCTALLAGCGIKPSKFATTEPSVTLETPTGGWHYHGLIGEENTPRVAYPTPPIDRGAQRGRTLIEGTLANAKRATLAVNGNPLALYGDDDGHFARPYAFGAGSNGLTISERGKTLKRVQFYEANQSRTPARIRIALSWDDPKADLDLHIITPDGQHAFWGDPILSDGGGLDTDSVDGPGPEMFTLAAPQHGTFAVYVNYWGNLNSQGYNFDESSNEQELITAQISLVFAENTVDERRENFLVPLRQIGELTLIKTFRY
jgi:uncharacterized protein YfaP (DUF2135 family)